MPNISVNKLYNSRLRAVLLLGFSAGLPISLTNSTLQAWFTESHINILAIGTLTLLGLPYTLKFLWAPLLDYYGFKNLGKRKGWILLMQLCLACCLFFIAQMNPSNEAALMGLIAFATAFFSASQDIAIDAYRTDLLPEEERGLGASYYIFTYRMGLLVAGGLALIFADHFGWKWTYNFMGMLLLLTAVFTFLTPKTKEITVQANLFQLMILSIRDLIQREKIIFIVLFLVFYKLGDALALSLMTNFLLKGLHFSLQEIGIAYKAVSIFAGILGAFIGGVYLIRLNIYRALMIFGLAQAFSNFTFVILAMVDKNYLLMAGAIFIENFCSGLSTAAFLAYMMSLCDHRYTATQFALLSAIASLGRVFLGPVAAIMVQNLGWVQFYFWAFMLSFPGLIFLAFLRNKVMYHAPVTE